jgi:hypothetical protein
MYYPNHNKSKIMAQASKTPHKIESIIVFVILLIGLVGALSIFSGSREKLSDPGHTLEGPQPAYQVMQYTTEAAIIR